MRRRWRLIVGAVCLIVVAVALTGCLGEEPSDESGDDSPTEQPPALQDDQPPGQDLGPDSSVLLVVNYSGSWSGQIAQAGGAIGPGEEGPTNFYGEDRWERTLDRPVDQETPWIVTLTASKLDDSDRPLSVHLIRSDGTVIQEANTTEPFGTVSVTSLV